MRFSVSVVGKGTEFEGDLPRVGGHGTRSERKGGDSGRKSCFRKHSLLLTKGWNRIGLEVDLADKASTSV